MKKTGAQIITKLLEMHGIETAAGIPGGSILPLYDELTRSSIHHVLVRQEQAGGFIAQGMARTNGLPAVCLATSGPGAMNLLTAIADARCDSVPIIAITGQVNTYLIGTDAFQEADTFGLSFPITKHSVMVKSPEELLTVIPEAFKIAMNGRPGPVLIDVPRDVQTKTCEFYAWPKIKLPLKDDESTVRFHTKDSAMTVLLEKAAELLAKAKKPVLFVGGGCNSPEASKALRAFTKSYRIPAVSSLMGLGVIPSSCSDFAGMVGMHGTYAANKAMYESDLVLACGVRFDDRATGVVSKFCPNAKIIHIDIDAAEINKILDSTVSIVAKVETAVTELTKMLKAQKANVKNEQMRAVWADEIINVNKNTRSTDCGSPSKEEKNKSFTGSANPRTFIASIPALAEKAGLKCENLLVTTDVGQHQMWAAQYYPVEYPRQFLTSGSLGTMGFGLPAAIGAAIANPEKKVVCISGDGSILMNLQELATLSELNLNVTVIVLENGVLGMVHQQQEYLFEKNYSASEFIKNPDLLKISEGFGIESIDANSDSLWAEKAFSKGPRFVRLRIERDENVLPFVKAGSANIDAIRN